MAPEYANMEDTHQPINHPVTYSVKPKRIETQIHRRKNISVRSPLMTEWETISSVSSATPNAQQSEQK